MSEDLLDYVASQCNLYVSDLRLPESSGAILPIVKGMDCNLFSYENWSRSLSYIFNKPLYFLTSTSAKEYFIERLRMRLAHGSNEQTM